MKEKKTFADFIGIALPIRKPFPVKDFSTDVYFFDPQPFIEKEGCYNLSENGSVISVITDSTMYVIPYFRALIHLLETNGFAHSNDIVVPLSIGKNYPLKYGYKWNQLLNRYFKNRDADFLADCEKRFDECGIIPLPDTLLKKRCMEIPDGGILTQDTSWINTIYPEISGFSRAMDKTITNKVGTYNICNGVCVFVYRNGHTYITHDTDIIAFIQKNGFILKDTIKVPLSNGELIVDENFQKWEAISA